MKGLYVPQSVFSDMIREMGSNSVQGTQMDMAEKDFSPASGANCLLPPPNPSPT
jgi:hypothetical protein